MTTDLDWTQIKHFGPDEFADDPRYAEPDLIRALDSFRDTLGERVFPSPVPGSLARFSGSEDSQHYVGPEDNPTRLSTAVDVFPEGIPILAYTVLLSIPKIKGVGVYLNTVGGDGGGWIMFHLDIRKSGFAGQPLVWICEKVWDIRLNKKVNKYRYPQAEPKYWSLLRDPRLYSCKEWGRIRWVV